MSIAEKLTTIAKNVPKVFEAGQKSEYDRFWDNFQQHGARTAYNNAFYGNGWTNENFKPKYNMIFDTCGSLFNNACINDIKGIIESQGIIFDTSNATSINSIFYTTNFEKDKATTVPSVDATSVTGLINATYYGQHRLTKIELLNIQEKATFQRVFHGCKGLVDLIITGTIGGAGLDLSPCEQLSRTSIERVVGCLSTSATEISITLSVDAVNKAFETSEGAADGSTSAEWTELANTKSNWTINLV